MKIIYVITKSNWGGAQRYVFDLATHLPKDEFEVMVVTGNKGTLTEKLEEKGIRVININSLKRDISLTDEILSFFKILTIFIKEKPDIVHLNSSKAGGIGALAGRMARIKKIIFTAHGWPFLENRYLFSRALIWLASWFTVLLCHKVICISDYDLRISKRMPFVKKKIVRIYNGIVPMSLGSGEKIRSAFPVGAHITGTIGELNKNKNQQALIEEAKNNPKMYVAIVGIGENYFMLDEKIKKYNLQDRVKLFGFMPASEAMPGFNIFSLPSIKEGLPYVLIEAKFAGLPIVANRVGGVSEILDEKDMSKFSLEKMLMETVRIYG